MAFKLGNRSSKPNLHDDLICEDLASPSSPLANPPKRRDDLSIELAFHV